MAGTENGLAVLCTQAVARIEAVRDMNTGSRAQINQLITLSEQAEALGWRELSILANRLRHTVNANCGSVTVNSYCTAMNDAVGLVDNSGLVSALLSQRMWG